MEFQGRHGDVLFEGVAHLPSDARLVERGMRYIAAYGEATGHAHTVEAPTPFEVWETPDGTRYMVTGDGVTVTHQEHGLKPLPAGVIRIVHQREQDWLVNEARRVVD